MGKEVKVFVEDIEATISLYIDEVSKENFSSYQAALLQNALKLNQDDVIKYHIFNPKLERYLFNSKEIFQCSASLKSKLKARSGDKRLFPPRRRSEEHARKPT